MTIPHEVGRWGEQKAKAYLQQQGYQILAQNYRTAQGEIDLIAKQGKTIIFVEVKTRRSLHFGSGVEAVTYRKRQRLRQVATHYLTSSAHPNAEVRFDVIDILITQKGRNSTYRIAHIKNIDG